LVPKHPQFISEFDLRLQVLEIMNVRLGQPLDDLSGRGGIGIDRRG
jgi:hypothetical protein